MAAQGAFLVANIVAYVATKERGAQFGMPADSLEKKELVLEGEYRSLKICRRAGVKVAYGTYLLGALAEDRSREFSILATVVAPIDVIRSATLIGAEVARRSGKLGAIEPGAGVDLLVVDGDPVADITLLKSQGRPLLAIMRRSICHKNLLP